MRGSFRGQFYSWLILLLSQLVPFTRIGNTEARKAQLEPFSSTLQRKIFKAAESQLVLQASITGSFLPPHKPPGRDWRRPRKKQKLQQNTCSVCSPLGEAKIGRIKKRASMSHNIQKAVILLLAGVCTAARPGERKKEIELGKPANSFSCKYNTARG